MASVVGSFVAIKFVQLFTKPFTDWTAYKLGLIDEKGQKLRDAENKSEEKEFVSWKNLIRKLKIILEKVPLGSFGRRLATFASAFWLLKEELDSDGYNGEEIINILYEEIKSEHTELLIESNELLIESGKYSLKNSTSLIIIREDHQPIGKMFGVNIYEVVDILTTTKHVVALADLDKV